MLEPIQVKMGRAALGCSTRDLAALAGVGLNTANRFERNHTMREATLNKIEAVFRDRGISFFRTPSGDVGVLAKKVVDTLPNSEHS